MELRHLRYFVAVAEAENVSRAALTLHVSQPGVSRQIRDLEDEIGFQLFERSAKSVRLTAAGKVFLREARAVLRHAEAAVQEARAVARGGGEIHVGYAPSLTARLLPAALRRFQGEFSRVRVTLHDLSSEELFARIGAKQMHVALTVRPPGKLPPRFRFEELARYAWRVAVAPSHPLAKRKSVSLAQVAREPLLAYRRKDYPEYHDEIGKLFSTAGCRPRIAEEHEGASSLIAAVEAGRGVAFVPDSMACMTGARLKLLPLKPAPPPIPVGALWLKEPRNELAEKFVAAAMEAILAQGPPLTATATTRSLKSPRLGNEHAVG